MSIALQYNAPVGVEEYLFAEGAYELLCYGCCLLGNSTLDEGKGLTYAWVHQWWSVLFGLLLYPVRVDVV